MALCESALIVRSWSATLNRNSLGSVIRQNTENGTTMMFLSLVSIWPSLPSMPMLIWRTAPTRGFSIVSIGQAAKCRPGSAVGCIGQSAAQCRARRAAPGKSNCKPRRPPSRASGKSQEPRPPAGSTFFRLSLPRCNSSSRSGGFGPRPPVLRGPFGPWPHGPCPHGPLPPPPSSLFHGIY